MDNHVEGLGFAPAPYGRRIMSALTDFIILVIAYMLIGSLLSFLFAGAMKEKIYVNEVHPVNEQNNLVYRFEGSSEEHLSYIFSEDQLKDIVTKEEAYQAAIVEGKEDTATEKKEARLYCLDQSKACALSEAEIAVYVETLTEPGNDIFFIEIMTTMLDAIIIALIFSFAIPLFNKNRQTIGRRLFKFGLLSNKGQTVPPLYLLIRVMVGVSIEFALCIIFASPFPLMISVFMMFVTKRRQTFRDFCSNTIVVDLREVTENVPRLDVV